MITTNDDLEALRRRAAASIAVAVDTCVRAQNLVCSPTRTAGSCAR